MKLGVPKLINAVDKSYGDNTYSIMVDDVTLTNVMDIELNLSCSSNNVLTMKIIDPEIDVKIGPYHITSITPNKSFVKLYSIVDRRNGDKVYCQSVNFDGKILTIGAIYD